MPALFVAHGAPMLALDARKGEDFARWGRTLTRARALLVVSAHWTPPALSIGSVVQRPLIYDFSGFPPALYQVQYPAPGAPELGERVAALLGPALQRDASRGLDHGVWVPLVHMFPKPLPVLQLSLPLHESPASLVALGRKLSPLRDEGVLIVGSGNLTHNLRQLDFADRGGPPPSWAGEFDDWVAGALARFDVDEVIAYRERAPALAMAHPTHEHFVPLLVSLGAAAGAGPGATRTAVSGFEYGSLSRRSVELG